MNLMVPKYTRRKNIRTRNCEHQKPQFLEKSSKVPNKRDIGLFSRKGSPCQKRTIKNCSYAGFISTTWFLFFCGINPKNQSAEPFNCFTMKTYQCQLACLSGSGLSLRKRKLMKELFWFWNFEVYSNNRISFEPSPRITTHVSKF